MTVHLSIRFRGGSSDTTAPPPPPPPPPPSPPPPPPSPPGAATFDGRESIMTHLGGGLNTSTGVNDQSQTPTVWSALGYINGDVTLAADAHYGKTYRFHVNEASRAPYYDPGTYKGATELAVWRPAAIGTTEWYTLAVRLDPSWVQPTWNTVFEPNFPGVTSPPLSINTAYRNNSTGQVTWAYSQVGVSTLYWDLFKYTGIYGSLNRTDIWLRPVTLGRWIEFVWGITWATDATGMYEISTREWEAGEAAFTVRAAATNVVTYQSYVGGAIGRDPTTDIWFLYSGTEPSNGWPTPLWDNYCNMANLQRFADKASAVASFG